MSQLTSFFSHLKLAVPDEAVKSLKESGVRTGKDAIHLGAAKLQAAGLSQEAAEKVTADGPGAVQAMKRNHPLRRLGKGKKPVRRPNFTKFDEETDEDEQAPVAVKHPLLAIAPRISAREVVSHSFSFRRVGDGEGIIAWLGMHKGRSSWSNPAKGAHPEVSLRTSGEETPALYTVTDKAYTSQNHFFNTQGTTAGQWIELKFESVVVCPSVYSLATGTRSEESFLRSWVLEASSDGTVWETLDRRRDDATLTAAVPWAAFSTPPCTKYYRHFRLKMDEGGNTSGTDELYVACFELYGTARECKSFDDTLKTELKKPLPPPPPAERQLNYFKPHGNKALQSNHGALAYVARNSQGGSCLDVGFKVTTNGKVVGSSRAAVDRRFTNKQIFYSEKIKKEGESDTDGEPVWVKFAFPQNISVSPVAYSFSHRAGSIDFFPRSWTLHASADGTTWDELMVHQEDDTINYKNKTGVWTIPAAAGVFYSQFKLTMDHKGNSKGTNSFVITCWEVYGTVRDTETRKKKKEKAAAPAVAEEE